MQWRDITSADCTILVVVEDLYPAGFKLEQFSTDAMAALADEEFAVTRMGVDTKMVAGYVDNIKSVTITLEPSSPSRPYLDALMKALRSARHPYWVTLSINVPAQQKTYIFSNGVLKTAKTMADLQRVQAPIAYVFDFEKVS